MRMVLGLIVSACAVVAALGQSDATRERNKLMYSMGSDGYITLPRMVRGQLPFDQAKVDTGFAKFAEVAAKLPPLWPESTKGQKLSLLQSTRLSNEC